MLRLYTVDHSPCEMKPIILSDWYEYLCYLIAEKMLYLSSSGHENLIRRLATLMICRHGCLKSHVLRSVIKSKHAQLCPTYTFAFSQLTLTYVIGRYYKPRLPVKRLYTCTV